MTQDWDALREWSGQMIEAMGRVTDVFNRAFGTPTRAERALQAKIGRLQETVRHLDSLLGPPLDDRRLENSLPSLHPGDMSEP